MKFLKKFKFFLFLTFLCVLFFLIIFFVNQFFLIKKIELISDKEFLLANKSELIDRSLIFINQDEIAQKIVQKNPQLKLALVDKVWPATLKVSVYFYEPIASLIVNQGFFNLSADGRILSKIKEGKPSLPIINFYQKLDKNSFQTGDWIDYKHIRQTLLLIEKLALLNLAPLTIDIKGQDMLVFNLKGEKKIIFSIEKKRELQEYQLELIIKQFKIEGKEFKKIDLRFNKPIVQF